MTDNEIDWTVLELEEVEAACNNAARRVMRDEFKRLGHEERDLVQTARMLVAGVRVTGSGIGATGMAQRTRELVGAGRLGALNHELFCDLWNYAEPKTKQAVRSTSLDARYDDTAETHTPPYPAFVPRSPMQNYDRAQIKALLPAVWDQYYAYGMQAENAPDSDMPRAAANKATGNVLWAHLADIRIAWKRAALNIEQRRALFLAYGLDWGQQEIAYNQGVHQSTISNRLTRGVEGLLGALGVVLEAQGSATVAA